MRLSSLTLSSFKKFATPVRLDDIGEGLNVVVGPNEMGKSTLFDAIHAVLFEKHTSQARPIEALQNDRYPAGPTVALTFEENGGAYRIEKRFLKKPYARLTCPDGRLLEGHLAEEELQSVLGFSQAARVGAKPETLGMWSVLWVRQGNSFGPFSLPDAARTNLQNALVCEVGDVLGGRRGRALLEVIERDLGALVTTGGHPRGDYKGKLAHLDDLKRKLAELEAQRKELAQAFADLAEAKKKLVDLASGERDRADQDELAATRTRRSELGALEARIQAAQSETDLRKHDVERAEQAADERRKLSAALAAAERAVTEATALQASAIARQTEAQEKLASLGESLRQAERAADEAEEKTTRHRRVVKLVDRALALRALESQCELAQNAENRRREARRAAQSILVTDALLTRIAGAAHELDTLNARLDAQATAITFAMDPGALSGISVDGRPLQAGDFSLRAAERTEIVIAERGRITIEPATKNYGKLVLMRRGLETELGEALRDAGVASLEEARTQHAARQKSLQETELAAQEAALHSPATDERDAGPDALADYIEVERRLLAEEKVALSLADLPPRPEAEAELTAAESTSTATRQDARITRARFSAPEEALRGLAAEAGAAKERLDNAVRAWNELLAAYQRAEEAIPRDGLQAAAAAARVTMKAQQAALAALEAQRTGETLPQLDARIGRLERAIDERKNKRGNLAVEIAALRSRIGAYSDQGIDEALADKRREHDRSESECKAFAAEVEVLALLLGALRAAEREAKERYLSPVLRRVEPYLCAMFPGASITIDENLEITGLVREAGYQEAFGRLSLGTQEQIAVLVRLAFAEMLVEQGHPASIILDDALVFSDDRRMKLMFDILTMAARKVQIVVLTCREQLFEGLGARELMLRVADGVETGSA